MFAALAPKLFDMGWRGLIPVNGKRPALSGWPRYNTQPNTPKELRLWASTMPDANIGLCAGHGVVMVDLDHTNEAVAAQVRELAGEILGRTSLVRVGCWPKTLRVYGCGPGVIKSRKFRGLSTEIFGTSGQCVIYGTHADTGRPYEWIDKTPLDVPPGDLPTLDAAQIDRFISRVHQTLEPACGDSGATQKPQSKFSGQFGSGSATLARIRQDRSNGLVTALKMIKAAAVGERHTTAVEVTFALAVAGWRDDQIETLREPFLRRFETGAERYDEDRRFTAMIDGARAKIGPDAETAARAVYHHRWSRWR